MTKKNKKSKDEQPAESFEHKVQNAFKKINIDTAGKESVEDKADLTEASPAEDDAAEDKAGSAETAPAGREAEAAASSPESESSDVSQSQEAGASDEASMDDLLDDVRRSLIEDEAQSEEKKPGWIRRIAKGFQKDQPVVESSAEPEVIPSISDVPIEAPKEDEYLDEIDELIEMLEPEASVGEPKPETLPMTEAAPPQEPEPEAPVDMEELKKRVFSPREGAEETEMSEVRAVALEGEGGEDVFVEVEARKEDAAQERRKAFENSLRPYRQSIYFAIAFLGVVLALLAVGIMYTAYQRTRPPEPTPIVSNLPYPVAMSLPGGLNFNLGKGSITDGQWNPRGPEWLQGTEICRWVAIPWSKQLEAVVRTLTPDDSIELVMSNNDRLSYAVYSIQELTLEEMQALDQNSPCLLLVLAEQDAEKRWVVTAKP
jgi:hypothetical protein